MTFLSSPARAYSGSCLQKGLKYKKQVGIGFPGNPSGCSLPSHPSSTPHSVPFSGPGHSGEGKAQPQTMPCQEGAPRKRKGLRQSTMELGLGPRFADF